MEGDLWKLWRGIFNPGFSAAYLMSLTRGIVEETEQFCTKLQERARDQTLFRMKDLTDNLTMDIIGRVVMNAQLGSQVQNLVLTTYLSDNPSNSKLPVMDKTFKKFTMNQIKLFLFSGHDTTSSTVCYIVYILATQLEVLARVRAEHASVFGPDTSITASLIQANPPLLNRLPYTIAIIKEVMRLYPAVSSTRIGEQDFDIIDEAGGQHFPTRDFLVWDRDPRLLGPTRRLRPGTLARCPRRSAASRQRGLSTLFARTEELHRAGAGDDGDEGHRGADGEAV
ncbi:MAG: hypothetical protein LQ346_003602 [Caloplaca aetnensis]|nr:MAG: hypothetical protein LQ346_003602 [Caloplaca aetnensis]